MVEAESGLYDYCEQHEPSYHHRSYYSGTYNWCVVPSTGQDAILFASVAVVVACLAQGRYSNSIILLAGAAVQGFVLPYNLGRFGNGIAIWLGIQPYELFFYIFLPPLLLDAAVRIDFYLFKKVVVQVITLAFLVVGGSVGFMIPVMLYILDLKKTGWNWQYVSLFISMLASTDAVAIISTMKTSGGPKRLRVLLEGEALLNDASSFTLFEIFLHLVEQYNSSSYHEQSGWSVFGDIVKQALKLAFGGLAIGLAFGIVCRYLLRFMRQMGASIDQQVSLTLALAYLSYYVANSPARVSGVVSVACFGLFGAATSKWDMSAKVEESGAFDAFWDTLSFVCNGIVFFFSGVACINFFVRSSQELENSSHGAVLASTIWRLPLIFIFMFIARFVLTTLFRPMFKIFLGDMGWRETIFATAAGLRGSVSLILAQAVVTDEQTATNSDNQVIKSEIVLWTAGFVLMTLLINGSCLPFILRKTGLSKVSEGKMAMRKRATKALASHTETVLENLKADKDEMLRGVDWDVVAKSTSVCGGVYCHFMDPTLSPRGDKPAWWQRAWAFCCCHGRKLKRKKKASQPPRKLLGNHAGLGQAEFFGRTSGLGKQSQDLESGFFEDPAVLEKFPAPLDEESSQNEEANEHTVGSEFPFFGSQPPEDPQPAGRNLKRASTFASFGLGRSKKPGEADPEDPAKLDRDFKSGPEGFDMLKPTLSDAELGKAGTSDGASSSRLPTPVQEEQAPGSSRIRHAYIMTKAGPLLAPFKQAEAPSEREESSGPTLRIAGEALKKLMQEGTNDKTWPKIQRDSMRPPLPFKKSLVEKLSSMEPSTQTSGDLNEQSSKTWTASTAGKYLSSPSSSLNRNKSGKRPSLFDAFDIERPTTGMGHKTVAKHKNIYDAFGVTDNQNSWPNKTSNGSPRQGSLNTSPQQTWTAGMTRKSSLPPEIVQALRQSSPGPPLHPSNSEPEGVGLPSHGEGWHPADVLASKSSEKAESPFQPRSLQSKSLPSNNSATVTRSSQNDYTMDGLTVTNAMGTGLAVGIMSESEVLESRIRLVGGMKRYFHGKRVEGLLSSAALRILDNACDSCIEDPISIEMWEKIEKDATGSFWLRTLSRQTFLWRKAVLALKRRKSSDYRLFFYTRRALAWPLIHIIQFSQHILTKRMLIGTEVAIEYMLSLTYSPHMQLLRHHERASIVIDEVEDDLAKVWKFITDRELEAPERFRAIQTYRATMAVLKQQAAFIKSMYNSGLVDDMEHDELQRPIESRERRMERTGPTYTSLSVLQILHNLPFLRKVPNQVTEVLYRHGKLHMYRTGQHLPAGMSRSMFVITSGIVHCTYTDPQGMVQEYSLATGGLFGLYSAITGEKIPGKVEAVAYGNSQGRGPLVVEFCQSGIDLIKSKAAAGDEVYAQIELDLMRLSAIYLVERMKPRIMPYFRMVFSQQFQKLPKQQKLKRLSSLLSDDSRDESALEDQSISTSIKADEPQRLVKETSLQSYAELIEELTTSTVLILPAGNPYYLRSHMVLLKGTLKTSRISEGPAGQGEHGSVEYKAPFVFPYVPPTAGTEVNPLRFVAGYESRHKDAVLMVCELKDGGSILDPSLDPDEPSEEQMDQDHSEERDTVGELRGRPPSTDKPPMLRRASAALILNAGDTGEVSNALPRDNKKRVWWDIAAAGRHGRNGKKGNVSVTMQ